MTLSLIVAMTENRVIGKNNQLPWHLSEDLKRFKKITMGHPIIMGRKTFESIGRPLPGRQNIVLTRDKNYTKEGIDVAHTLADALSKCEQTGEEFVIGGASVFEDALPLARRLYLTLIRHPFEGDAYFPSVNLKNDFNIIEGKSQKATGSPEFIYKFIIAERKKKI